MNSFSHITVAKYLHRYLREQHGIELSRGDFIYGNLIPDFRPAYKKLPHTQDYWMRYLKSEFGKLSAIRQESAIFGVNYSRRLGVICHFYADFFCRAHTEDFEGGSYTHIRYELALNRHIKNTIPSLKKMDFGGNTARGRDAGTILSGYSALQSEYLSAPTSFDNDIEFTLRACIETLTAVAGNSVLQKKPTVGIFIPEPAKV